MLHSLQFIWFKYVNFSEYIQALQRYSSLIYSSEKARQYLILWLCLFIVFSRMVEMNSHVNKRWKGKFKLTENSESIPIFSHLAGRQARLEIANKNRQSRNSNSFQKDCRFCALILSWFKKSCKNNVFCPYWLAFFWKVENLCSFKALATGWK